MFGTVLSSLKLTIATSSSKLVIVKFSLEVLEKLSIGAGLWLNGLERIYVYRDITLEKLSIGASLKLTGLERIYVYRDIILEKLSIGAGS